MRILNQRIYIVTSPALAAAVQRASRALSFTPIIPEVTQPVLGLDDATMAIVRRNLDPGPEDEQGYLAEIQDLVYHSLGPGPYLGELTLDAVREWQVEIAAYHHRPSTSLLRDGSGGTTEDLLIWVRHLVTVGTARYLYGASNPIALDASLEDAFWDFDHGLVALLVNLWPGAALTARRAYEGRERLAVALGDYLEAGRHLANHNENENKNEKKKKKKKKASSGSGGERSGVGSGGGGGGGGSWIIRRRVEIALKHGWTLRAAARSELSFLFAGIVNTTTTIFWILARIYADAELLAAVRGEVEGIVVVDVVGQRGEGEGEGGEERKPAIRIPALRERCPTLVAVFNECLRLGSDNFSNRKVKEDTVLADRYVLQKGAIVQVAGGVIHADKTIWGDDVEAFSPRRFLPSPSPSNGVNGSGGGKGQGQRQQQQPRHPAAFRAFGGGKTLCPGRHFAQNEILGFVALVLLAFDMCAPGGGPVVVPRKKDTGLPVHILEPTKPVKVVISRRKADDGSVVDVEDINFTMD